MNQHAHISLCDKDFSTYYECVSFDIPRLLRDYLDIVYSMFRIKDLPRAKMEAALNKKILENSFRPVYFMYEDTAYVFDICGNCNLCALN